MNYLAILLGDPMAPILIGVAAGVLLGLIPMILYLITLSKTLTEVSEINRKMTPGQVWLVLIPLFGMVWQFIMVNRIADSLKAEFEARNIQTTEPRPGAQLGVAYCTLMVCGIIPVLGGLASLGGIVCWIIYWVKIKGFKDKLIQSKM